MARYSSRISDRHMVAVRFSALGDVALTTGVLLRYHQQHGTTFTVVTRMQFASLFDGNPAVSEVVGLKDEELHGPDQRAAFRSIVERWPDSPLLDLHRNLRSALLAKSWRDAIICYRKMSLQRRAFLWSKGRLCRETLRALNVPQRYATGLWDDSDRPPKEELCPKVFLSAQEKNWGDSIIHGLRQSHKYVVALHPFATHALKTWSKNAWLRFAQLLGRHGIGHVWIGLGEEMDCGESGISLINKTNVRQLCSVLGSADVLVTGDSAPMHLSDAVGTPVLALFGPTTQEWGFFPNGPQDTVLEVDLPCRPCSLHGSGKCPHHHACMEGISQEMALQQIISILERI